MSPATGDITFEYLPIGKSGRVQVLIQLPNEKFTDKVDVVEAAKREDFARKVCERYAGLDRTKVDRQLERIAGEMVARSLEQQEDGESDGVTEILAGLVIDSEDAELFHHGVRHDAEAYATIAVADHRETWPVRSVAFAHWLRQQYYLLTKAAPPAQALTDGINLIASIAVFAGEQREVFLRVARCGEAIYIDLGDARYRAVEVRRNGWKVIAGDSVPVRFIRRRGMEALPVPEAGGSIHDLWRFVNLPDSRSRILFAAVLVAYFWPNGPYIILVANGEQGSAKSTLCRFLRALIDPNKAGLRRPPRDDRDLMIAAKNGWIVGIDNLSSVSPNLADALCSLATGGGFGTRELYTDDEEKLFDAMRPVILNGIPELATRPDLLDRSIVFTLPSIPESDRRDEAALKAEFEIGRPRIFGAVLDGVSTAMRLHGDVKFDRLPRMADFALVAAASMPTFGWTESDFMDAYMGNREESHEAAIEASAIGTAIVALIADHAQWEGTATELLRILESRVDEKTKGRKDWPAAARGLRESLGRIAPNLRALGVNVVFGNRKPGGKRERLVVLERRAPEPKPIGDGRDGPPPNRDEAPRDDRPAENGPGDTEKAVRDEGDDRDGRKQTFEQEERDPDQVLVNDRDCSVGIGSSQSSRPSRTALATPATPISAGRSWDGQGGSVGEDRPEPDILAMVVAAFEGSILDGNSAPPPQPPKPRATITSNELFRDEGATSWGPDNA
jgi:hypothetical protein